MNRLHRSEPEDLWLITYGDVMTLLLAFFVALFAFSAMDEALYGDILKSLSMSLAGEGKGGVQAGPITEIEKVVALHGLGPEVQIFPDRSEIRLAASDTVLFEAGSAKIHPAAGLFLKEIATVIKNIPHDVRVEGHAGDEDLKGTGFGSAWELSSARAVAVVRALSDDGIRPERLSATAYAQFKPRYPPIPENRDRNRRVEIVLVPR